MNILDTVRRLLSREPATESEPSPSTSIDPLHVAACALLLDIAWADGEFSEAEREHLERILESHFALPPESGRRLFEVADRERQASVDYFRFTSPLQQQYDLDQRIRLAETIWGLILADGQIAEHEQYLAGKIAYLLGLKPAHLAAAREAAERAR